MAISQRVKNIETAMGIGTELVDAYTCNLMGLEYGVATMKDAKAIYERVCADPRSHPKYRIEQRKSNTSNTVLSKQLDGFFESMGVLDEKGNIVPVRPEMD